MNRLYVLSLIITVFLSCSEKKTPDQNLTKLLGVKWENSDLDFIGFDSILLYLPIKDMYPITCAFEFSLISDTLVIINKTVDAYNLVDYEDSISLLKLEYISEDSLKLMPLNGGANELFNGFESFTFYNSETQDRYSYYVETDSTCLNQIHQAKEQINHDTLVLGIHSPQRFRQKDEFIEILNQRDIIYKNLGPPPDVLPIARDCYHETMNYYLKKKFGDNFIYEVMKEADSLMIIRSSDSTFQYFECDERPRLPHEKKRTNDDMPSIEVTNLNIEKDTSYYGGWPFVDLGFIVHKDSTVSDFYVNYFVPHLETNSKYKEQLINLAINEIKTKYPKWVPGRILGKEVITDNNVRLFFVRN